MIRAPSVITLAFIATFAIGCSAPTTRFALRAPVTRDNDDRPILQAPKNNDESDIAHSFDDILFRPVSHAFLIEVAREAGDVTSLDEVPDSTWFQNRVVTPSEVELGPCQDAPVQPFNIKSTKSGGTTPGLVVKDARGQKYVLKLDELGPAQPEITTAADTVVSRLFWATGFNVPCNVVAFVDPPDLRITKESYETRTTGERSPLSSVRLAQILSHATRNAGKIRLLASRFIDGEDIGTWRTEGTRPDDPNDRVPHEDRRELRAERLLAAWVAHWDSRGANTFDAFVKGPRGGHVIHYFLDFSDGLGATAVRTSYAEPRLGFETVSSLGQIIEDGATLGLLRRPWDDVAVDPRFPDFGFFGVEHFDPLEFSPQSPLVAWARADASDLGWIARKIARIGPDLVRAAVRSARFASPVEEDRLVEILMGRRAKILRVAFARSSPLGEIDLSSGEQLAMTDLEAAGMGEPAPALAFAVRRGAERTPTHEGVSLERAPDNRILIRLPAHRVLANEPDQSAARYLTLDIVRYGKTTTTLRAHFYDLGAKRGYALVGIERP